MGVTSKRISTLRALTAGARSRTGAPGFNHVDHELQEVNTCQRVSPEKRRNLLQVFHGLRALESALKEVVASHGQAPGRSLGEVLRQLNGLPVGHPSHLHSSGLGRYMGPLRAERNRIMHTANAFPRTARDADTLLGEIAACFALLVR